MQEIQDLQPDSLVRPGQTFHHSKRRDSILSGDQEHAVQSLILITNMKRGHYLLSFHNRKNRHSEDT